MAGLYSQPPLYVTPYGDDQRYGYGLYGQPPQGLAERLWRSDIVSTGRHCQTLHHACPPDHTYLGIPLFFSLVLDIIVDS